MLIASPAVYGGNFLAKAESMNRSSSSSGDGSMKVESSGTSLASSSSSNQSSHPSSGSSGSYPSATSGTSMDTLPTQDVADGPEAGDEEDGAEIEEVKSWGRLFTVQAKYFSNVDLTENEYGFGRDTSCQYVFKNKNFRGKEDYFRSISKKHFKITREWSANGYEVFITDLSSNGTFLNGEKLGRNVKHPLHNNDEIAFPVKKNKAFVFNDIIQTEKENERFPEELRVKYTVGKLLGSGACGEVRLCYKKPSLDRFAVKILSKKKFSVGVMRTGEVEILQSLDHPCIVNIEEVLESEDSLFIILELVTGGELYDRVVAVKRFDEATAKLLFYQMLLAVEYLHFKDITHRDLKPENVLLSTDDNETLIKITDFGLSRFVHENSLMKTLCGTPNYLAPEVLRNVGTAGYSKVCDCWSLGCILYICLAGYPPFSDENPNKTMTQQTLSGDYTFPDAIWSSVSREAIDLIKRLLTVDPKARITVTEALQHPWINDDVMKEKAAKLMANDDLRSMSISSTDAGPSDMPPPLTPSVRKRPTDSTSNCSGEESDKKPRLESEDTDTSNLGNEP